MKHALDNMIAQGRGVSKPHEPTVATSHVMKIGNSGQFSRSQTHNLKSMSPDGPLAPTSLRSFTWYSKKSGPGIARSDWTHGTVLVVSRAWRDSWPQIVGNITSDP
jgi:hypothetical protein